MPAIGGNLPYIPLREDYGTVPGTHDNPLIQPGPGGAPVGARDVPGSADKNRFWDEDDDEVEDDPYGFLAQARGRRSRSGGRNPNVRPVFYGGQRGADRLKKAGRTDIGPGMPVTAAQGMEKAGTDSQTIFSATGWFHDTDGQWKWVQPDTGASLNKAMFDITPGKPSRSMIVPDKNGRPVEGRSEPEPDKLTFRPVEGHVTKLPEVYNHPELYDTYPFLKDAIVMPVPPGHSGLSGSYSRRTNKVELGANATEKDLLGTLAHELNHGAAYEEPGFGLGGNPGMFQDKAYFDKVGEFLDTNKSARAAAESALGDPKIAQSLFSMLAMKYRYGLNSRNNDEKIAEFQKKLPPEVFYAAMDTAIKAKGIDELDEKNLAKYESIQGEYASRRAEKQLETGDYGTVPTGIKGFPAPSEQLVRTSDQGGIKFTPGVSYKEVEHDPWTPAGTPMTLHPLEGDPFDLNRYRTIEHDPFVEVPDYQQRLQPQLQVPAPLAAALNPSGPDTSPLKWSFGTDYAAPSPTPANSQDIALNTMQLPDYPNYAQAP